MNEDASCGACGIIVVKVDDCVPSAVVAMTKGDGVFLNASLVEPTNGGEITCGVVLETLTAGFWKRDNHLINASRYLPNINSK